MPSWGKRGSERNMLECESFLSYVLQDACFAPKCEDKIKNTSSSDIKFPSTRIVFSFNF